MQKQKKQVTGLCLCLVLLVCQSVVYAQDILSVPKELVNYPDTIVINGTIYTMDNTELLSADPGSIVQAMAIRDEKILAVGSNQDMLKFEGPETRIIDVKGKTVIPGIIETHVHPESTMNAVRLNEEERDAYSLPPGLHTAILLPSDDPQDTYDAVAQFVSQYPPKQGEWVHIRLVENEDTIYPDIGSLTNAIYKDVFTMDELSRVIPNNPATLSSGSGPSAIVQPGLVIRVDLASDGKATMEPLSVPQALQHVEEDSKIAGIENPFKELFADNAKNDREDSFHAHIDQGCGYAEMFPHHMQHCSHRNILLNRKGLEETVRLWPGFIQAANDMTGLSDLGREGDRGIVGGVFQESGAWERVINPPRMPRDFTKNLMREALKLYNTAGLTMISSSVEYGTAMTAVFDILREDRRLPVRWGFGYEMFRSPVMYPNNNLIVAEMGAQHSTAHVNPWFWPTGITDGGVGDSRQVACFGDDLPGPEMLKDRELCWDDQAYRITNVLIPAMAAGWRPFSLHSFGSEAFRKHMAWIEQARVEGRMSMDDIREMRIGFAHGGAVGKIPDVMEIMKDYNFYVPLQPNDVAASLKQVKRYGPEGLEFLSPTKTLIESGVNIVGETEYSHPRPDIYFNAFDMFVNRRVRHESEPLSAGEIVMPEEAVSRATALRLFTSKASEWLFTEDLAGTLEPGKFADFTVLDKDYFSVPTMDIPLNKAIMTVVGDMIMYTDAEYQPEIK